MGWPQRFLAHVQSSSIHGFRLFISLAIHKQGRQVVGYPCDVGMVLPRGLFLDGQGTAIQRLSLEGAVLVLVDRSQVIQDNDQVWVFRYQIFLQDSESL